MVLVRRWVLALLPFALGWLLVATASAATTDTTTTVTTTTTATSTSTTTTTSTTTEPARTETTTVTSTATHPHTTTVHQTTTAPHSGGGKSSSVPGWVWILIGLAAAGVALAAYMLGRSSGARSEYEAQQRAAAAAGYPPGPDRPLPPRRPAPPPDWPQ